MKEQALTVVNGQEETPLTDKTPYEKELPKEWLEPSEVQFLREALLVKSQAEALFAFVIQTISKAHGLTPEDRIDESGVIYRHVARKPSG
jgi:hypothetical protein